ncbi:MAG TPA: PilW family protein [Methylotenera sp.]|nr:PilW family protein [Methylotenera sp.]
MTFNKYSIPNQKGFSLIEIMIGLVIGLLVTLVIIQVMSVFESQKRSTTGTADAQTNGAIALYNISRELKFAGYSLMPSGFAGSSDSPIECTALTLGTTGIAATTPAMINLSPAIINNGVAVAGVSNASDTITIRYGTSRSGGIPSIISAAPIGRAITVTSNFGCQSGDTVLINGGATCAMGLLATATDSPAGVTGTTTVNLRGTETVPAIAAAGSKLSCMGIWNTITYAVVNGNLQRNGVDTVAGVVNIQAQYGISNTVNDNQINAWVEPTGAWSSASLTTTTRNRIKALRIAIVARNTKMEPAVVTSACDSTTGTGLCAWADIPVGGTIDTASPAPPISLSDGDTNWARYHYRVFETVIPLRNMIWSRETL